MQPRKKTARHVGKGKGTGDDASRPLVYSKEAKLGSTSPHTNYEVDDVDLFLPAATEEAAVQVQSELEAQLQKLGYTIKKETTDSVETLTATKPGAKDAGGLVIQRSTREEAGTGAVTHGLDITVSNPAQHKDLLDIIQKNVPANHLVYVDQCGNEKDAMALIKQFGNKLRFSINSLEPAVMAKVQTQVQVMMKSDSKLDLGNLFPEDKKPSLGKTGHRAW